MFKLVDIAGYIKVMDSAAWRNLWVRGNHDSMPVLSDPDSLHSYFTEDACAGYFDYASREIHQLDEEFERDLTILKQGLYPPDIRVAQLALQTEEEHEEQPSPKPAHRVTRPFHVLAVLNIVPILSPLPRIVNGELLETHFDIDGASRTALERALELKSTSEDVTVTAIAVAPGYATEVLRRTLALGVDNAALIKTDYLPDNPHDVARLVADLAGQKQLPCDLVLCGDAILAAVLAGNLGSYHFTGVEKFVVNGEQTTIHLLKPDTSITHDGPVVLAIAEGETDLNFQVDDYFDALNKPLEVIDALQLATASRPGCRYQLPEKPATEEKFESTPEAIAALVRKIAGIETASAQGGSEFFHRQSGIHHEGEAARMRDRRVPGNA